MKKYTWFILVMMFIAFTGFAGAQEFPIAVGSDNTFGGGGAGDGTNILFAIQGDNTSQYSMTAQLVSMTGNLVGSRISLGAIGSGQLVAFDGTNFLMVWVDSFPMFGGSNGYATSSIYGQFISRTGTLVGSKFTIVNGVNIKFGKGRGALTFKDTTYFLTYLKGGDHLDYLYGQRISKSGTVLGNPIQISSNYARECAVSFDGTNYLVAWCDIGNTTIKGQFVSSDGTSLVGSNFVIDGSSNASDNPVTMTYDGTNYFVAFHDQAGDNSSTWNLYGRFVSTEGTILDRLLIVDSTYNPMYATAVFDGVKYFATWLEMGNSVRVGGRYFSRSGEPIGTPFIVFDTLNGRSAMGGVGGYGDGQYILSVTRFDNNFTNGDVYIKFMSAFPNGVNENNSIVPGGYALSQNYPNPFNPSTVINYQLANAVSVSLKIYNSIGQEIATLVDGIQDAGFKSIAWNASNIPTGMYYYRLTAGTFTETKKLMLIR